MENPITEIFTDMPNERLIKVASELINSDGDFTGCTEFKKVCNEVRVYTNSETISSDHYLVKNNIFKESTKRFINQNF